ncbi:recombinase [Komagataeibacter medellinensis]|uniref:Recombinase n=1 Tax=Komagataeibacter medellinensis TaxID=1177712 RepID=A0ABQ6VXN6_9PROT|nr:recombinase [Komagataeibacter medellinensis]KAB8124934.1 recombinase [Komagataeibacter medellinensis]
MDGGFSLAGTARAHVRNPLEGAFGTSPLPGRALDRGMGEAVGRRTVFRPADHEDFGRVADRVARGNTELLPTVTPAERAQLRNAIATGALLTSGRHLQHGDAAQPGRNMEMFTNCATAICSFAKFYLLLNGSGVGRAYDDELCVVDWGQAPDLQFVLSPSHPDYPHDRAGLLRLGLEMQILPWGTGLDAFDAAMEGKVRAFLSRNVMTQVPEGAEQAHVIADSREGWGKAVEMIEAMAFAGARTRTLVFDFSAIRCAGSPIAGMQGRPASGPVSLLRGLLNVRDHVIRPARAGSMALWEQALRVDHYLSVEVQVGGARRAARMATKSWRDADVLRFIRAKEEGGLWTANHSVMVDAEFWACVNDPARVAPLADHARAVFAEATRCAWINGEPGFINGDRLEDSRTGSARRKPVYTDGRDFRSHRYQATEGAGLLADLARRAAGAHFPVTTNPCGEITLHVTGGYCVIGDFAPLLACPVALDGVTPGHVAAETAAIWDARVRDAVRLGVRFLLRANRMDALYGEEVRRTNRIGIGPTGLHEWAWLRFGLDFHDLLDETRAAPFWDAVRELSTIAKTEANAYAHETGTARPVTVTTVKPAGTTSKLFGLTEGAHLPARRQYLRWVQFKGVQCADGTWETGSDPLLADYASRGYPVRSLRSFPGMSIVGFPTVPLIQRLGMGGRVVTAPEATPAEQYRWLELLEKYWIGAAQGNQVSYTLKVYTDRHDLAGFRAMVAANQPHVRCCAVLPSRPDSDLGYEYLPEEEVPAGRFAAITAAIHGEDAREVVDWAHLQCASGACPI